ncbi:MAG: hypothetical protein J1E60_01440 [Christensenellaceae bacterium]|nr:hypothetical protein [Christensenellaceae bacterium]
MLLGCYYKDDKEVLLIYDLAPTDHNKFVCYKCKRNECGDRESLIWNAYYPVGKPFLKSRSELEVMQCLNERCLSCVYRAHHRLHTVVGTGKEQRIAEFEGNDLYNECRMRRDFLINSPSEMFAECSYYDDGEIKIEADIRFLGVVDELLKLYTDYGVRRIYALTLRPSPAVFDELILGLDEDDLCYFCGIEISYILRESMRKHHKISDDRTMCIVVKKRFLNSKLYVRMMTSIGNSNVIYIPKKNIVIAVYSHSMDHDNWCYFVCAPTETVERVQELESEAMQVQNKLFHTNLFALSLVQCDPEKWNLDLYGNQNDFLMIT